MKLLERINERSLPGEVNFYPLNRILDTQRREVTDQVFFNFLISKLWSLMDCVDLFLCLYFLFNIMYFLGSSSSYRMPAI
jgi:hypothetical protein